MTWAVMVRTALAMGIAPDAFWRLSVREWRMLMAADAGAATMGRGDLEKMMEAWPDD